MSELRPKIVRLAKMVGGIAGAMNKIDENSPEYYALNCVVTDDMADIAMIIGLRKPRTFEYVAKRSGKSKKETKALLEQLAYTGVAKVWKDKEDHKERFFVNIFAPGMLEMMVNNREQLNEHPEIGKAFEEYTRLRLAPMAAKFPQGMAMMRVIPVEEAIKDIPGTKPWERLSYYLEKYDTFTVSDCSCRQSRRVLDEGCGHLEKEICIQMGEGAEYYMKTGRGRQISREEAKEIIKFAENNGLMHEMPHTDGLGESAAICNCCGCSCFSLRLATLFNTPDSIRSNFTAKVKKENCVACGQCVENCPVNALKLGYHEALELIKKENPFPAVCGRICPHGCESECTRGDIDEPVSIDEIKKFIADKELDGSIRYIPPMRYHLGNKIAVVGSGPSGLSCAYYLAIDGYQVTVFEKEEKLGGMLTLGIPSFRLEKEVLNAEIDVLREMGVIFKNGIEVGKDITLKELRKEGYEAFYLAIGAQGGRNLGIEGEDAEGVISGVDFLRNVNLGKKAELSGNVVVIGGGNVAIDVARTGVRQGAAAVNLYSLESSGEMPALPEEIAEAEEDNVSFHNGWGPKRILTEDGKVTGVEFKRCISVFDENRRFAPKYDENDTITVEADTVLLSIGQTTQWGGLLSDSKVELGRGGTAKADSLTLQTSEPDVRW